MNSLVSTFPHARREGLNVTAVSDEILVFDPTDESAHTLNGPAAFVWQHADGARTIDEIAREMTRAFGAPADAPVVWYALEQLHKRHLMQGEPRTPMPYRTMTRRQFLKRAVAGAALLAVVTSIVTPTVAHAQSGCVGTSGGDCSSAPCCADFECCEPVFQCFSTCDA